MCADVQSCRCAQESAVRANSSSHRVQHEADSVLQWHQSGPNRALKTIQRAHRDVGSDTKCFTSAAEPAWTSSGIVFQHTASPFVHLSSSRPLVRIKCVDVEECSRGRAALKLLLSEINTDSVDSLVYTVFKIIPRCNSGIVSLSKKPAASTAECIKTKQAHAASCEFGDGKHMSM